MFEWTFDLTIKSNATRYRSDDIRRFALSLLYSLLKSNFSFWEDYHNKGANTSHPSHKHREVEIDYFKGKGVSSSRYNRPSAGFSLVKQNETSATEWMRLSFVNVLDLAVNNNERFLYGVEDEFEVPFKFYTDLARRIGVMYRCPLGDAEHEQYVQAIHALRAKGCIIRVQAKAEVDAKTAKRIRQHTNLQVSENSMLRDLAHRYAQVKSWCSSIESDPTQVQRLISSMKTAEFDPTTLRGGVQLAIGELHASIALLTQTSKMLQTVIDNTSTNDSDEVDHADE